MDERIIKFAKNLVHYSVKVQEGEKVFLQYTGEESLPLVRQLVKEIYNAKGVPVIKNINTTVLRELLLGCTKKQMDLMAEADSILMNSVDCYIGISAKANSCELADVPSEKLDLYNNFYVKPVHLKIRLKKKWCILGYPNYSIAQSANMSLEAFEEFYYKVCTLDYEKMSRAMDSLVELMNRTDRVRITGEGTDLNFSIKDISAIKCCGELNIPDGEVYTAPVRDSVNGVISYNTPSIYNGFEYQNVRLVFENGKIIEATSNDNEKINKVFDLDEGARYVGEFAIGVNPFITKPMKDILFDEKIMGSFHFTPGACYEDAWNGNESAVHWDLVCIQTPEYKGGCIYFDDVMVRKDGRFVLSELECLNPENLM